MAKLFNQALRSTQSELEYKEEITFFIKRLKDYFTKYELKKFASKYKEAFHETIYVDQLFVNIEEISIDEYELSLKYSSIMQKHLPLLKARVKIDTNFIRSESLAFSVVSFSNGFPYSILEWEEIEESLMNSIIDAIKSGGIFSITNGRSTMRIDMEGKR